MIKNRVVVCALSALMVSSCGGSDYRVKDAHTGAPELAAQDVYADLPEYQLLLSDNVESVSKLRILGMLRKYRTLPNEVFMVLNELAKSAGEDSLIMEAVQISGEKIAASDLAEEQKQNIYTQWKHFANDGQALSRGAAIRALTSNGLAVQENIPIFRESLTYPNAEVRLGALMALFEAMGPSEEYISILLAMLEDKDRDVRHRVFDRLAYIAQTGGHALIHPHWKTIVAHRDDENESVLGYILTVATALRAEDHKIEDALLYDLINQGLESSNDFVIRTAIYTAEKTRPAKIEGLIYKMKSYQAHRNAYVSKQAKATVEALTPNAAQ